MAEVHEALGVRTAVVDLPNEFSGRTLSEPSVGLPVVANHSNDVLRRRSSYSQVFLDRDKGGLISRAEELDNMIEARTDAFGANFLMHGLFKKGPLLCAWLAEVGAKRAMYPQVGWKIWKQKGCLNFEVLADILEPPVGIRMIKTLRMP